MDLLKTFEDEAIKWVVVGVLTVIGVFIRLFRKVPNIWLQQYRKKKVLEGLQRELEKWKLGGKINTIIRPLKDSGAIYIHVIRYFNGDYWKMTVQWEELGNICPGCLNQCPNYTGIVPLQKAWIAQPVSSIWNQVLQNTITLEGKINDVNCNYFNQLDKKIYSESDIQLHKDIFTDAQINLYKEILLTHKARKETWTLGLSFCSRITEHREANLMMEMAARQLRRLINAELS